MLTRAISRTNQRRKKKIPHRQSSPEISRLLSAAVINKGFRDLLLADPARALAQGFCGEEFSLDFQQKALILSIQADCLSEFAKQITAELVENRAGSSAEWIPINQPSFVMHAK